jgi:hypothetical protein
LAPPVASAERRRRLGVKSEACARSKELCVRTPLCGAAVGIDQ